MRDPSKHNPEDKLRLLLCYYFSSLASGSDKGLSKDDLAEFERALAETGADMGPWEFAKRLRDVMRMSSLGAAPAQPVAGAGGDLLRGFSSLSNRVRLLSCAHLLPCCAREADQLASPSTADGPPARERCRRRRARQPHLGRQELPPAAQGLSRHAARRGAHGPGLGVDAGAAGHGRLPPV